ncbi:hypothetical protein ES705_47189 [subsurface metagenome]
MAILRPSELDTPRFPLKNLPLTLLGLMGTGLSSIATFDNKMGEFYAADSGVEDAIWKINHRDDVTGMPKVEGDLPLPYHIGDINGYEVSVDISWMHAFDGGTYLVISKVIATADGTPIENGTKIDAIVATLFGAGYGGSIMDNVITSRSGYVLQGPTNTYPGVGDENGPEGDYAGEWPTPEELAAYYWYDVYDLDPELSDTIYVEDEEYQPPPLEGLGPFFRDGTLSIINSGDAGLTLQLNGTLYITGDTLIGTTNQYFTLDLNGHTIFVESATTAEKQYALIIGTHCNIIGSGAIIAVGNIKFGPNMGSCSEDYILVMSVIGMTYMQPVGDFYGTLAGSSEVYIQNGDAYWTDPDGVDGGINFPGGGSEEGLHWGIFNLEIA